MSLMTLIFIACAITTVASIIAALTPTPTDDEWFAPIYKAVDILALNIGKAKEKATSVVRTKPTPKPKAKSGAKTTTKTTSTTAKK